MSYHPLLPLHFVASLACAAEEEPAEEEEEAVSAPKSKKDKKDKTGKKDMSSLFAALEEDGGWWSSVGEKLRQSGKVKGPGGGVGAWRARASTPDVSISMKGQM